MNGQSRKPHPIDLHCFSSHCVVSRSIVEWLMSIFPGSRVLRMSWKTALHASESFR